MIKYVDSRSQTKKHKLEWYISNKRVFCDCLAFGKHGRCGHIQFYNEFTFNLFYGNGFTEKFINSFKNCKELLEKILSSNPELTNDYGLLVEAIRKIKKYSPETITRGYRLLKRDPESTFYEPEEITIRREKAEHIMHDINQWDAKSFVSFNDNQSVLTPSEGVEKS